MRPTIYPHATFAPGEGGQGVDLLAASSRPFLASKNALISSLALQPRAMRSDIMLELAELYVSHGLLLEARSFLRAADQPGESGEVNPRVARVDVILRVLGAEAVSQTHPGFADSSWSAAGYFKALSDIHADIALTEADLEEGFKASAFVPDALLEYGLPQLLEAAIAGGHWAASRDFAELMLQHPTLNDAPALHFLLGRAADDGEEHVAAFDSYRLAAQGRDQWAHRARLAIIKLAERTNSLPNEDRLALLRAARWLWEGDEYSSETLRRLAEAEASVGNQVNALSVFHDLGQRNSGSLDAQKAAALSASLLDDFYSSGLTGDLPLSDFISGHSTIAADRRLEPGFAVRAEAFADYLFENGISSLAIREYAETAAYLAAAEELGLLSSSGADQNRLRLKQSEALMHAGQLLQAREVLDMPMLNPTENNLKRRQALRVRLLSKLGQDKELLELEAEQPALEFQVRKANALFEAGQWSNALDEYERLWAVVGEAMPSVEAARMVLAAHRLGDELRLEKVVQALSSLRASPDWVPLAAMLARDAPSLFPLRKDVLADALLDESSSALGEE
ncbi:hypothetical protein FIU97_12470 [Roseivivax sp. THAF40]|nr:hypothetical protein FIU97_12470 [Roseivivax sp. THAF40]